MAELSKATKWIRNIGGVVGIISFITGSGYTLWSWGDAFYVDKYELEQARESLEDDYKTLATSVKNIGIDYIENKIIEVRGDIDFLKQKRMREGLTSAERQLLATAEVRLDELINTLERLRNADITN
jgi:hypothetical protein